MSYAAVVIAEKDWWAIKATSEIREEPVLFGLKVRVSKYMPEGCYAFERADGSLVVHVPTEEGG